MRTLVKWLYEHVTPEALRAAFPTQNEAHRVVLYGEGYGAGIQKGGGDYTPEKRLILFDVTVRDQNAHDWWLSDENVRDVAAKVGLEVVPLIGELTLAEATEMVRAGFKSRAAVNITKDSEGLVGRPAEALFDKKGHRLIVKLKTKDFALKKRSEEATQVGAVAGDVA